MFSWKPIFPRNMRCSNNPVYLVIQFMTCDKRLEERNCVVRKQFGFFSAESHLPAYAYLLLKPNWIKCFLCLPLKEANFLPRLETTSFPDWAFRNVKVFKQCRSTIFIHFWKIVDLESLNLQILGRKDGSLLVGWLLSSTWHFFFSSLPFFQISPFSLVSHPTSQRTGRPPRHPTGHFTIFRASKSANRCFWTQLDF